MDKLIIEALRHLRAMWRYRRIGLFTTWIVAVACAVVIFAIPKKYEASARIFVNTDSILRPLMVGMTVQPDNSQRVALLSRLVISRPNVEQLVKETGLATKAMNSEQYEKLIDKVINVMDIESSGDKANNIYILKYKDTEPERARRMIELLVAKFIDSSKGGRATDTDAAKQFLDEQADVYEKKLQEAESRLKEFKLQNMTGMSADGRDYNTQMAAVKDQLSQAQLQLREAETSRDAYRRGLAIEDIAAAPTVGTNAAGESIADMDARIDAMKRNLDGLLQKYTESHPDVVGTRRVLRELNEQRRQLLEEYRKKGTPLTQVATTGPRASEQLKISLAQTEASVASLRARVAEYTTRYNQLREIARRMPEYEAQLAQLNRDYQINKKNYDDLAARRESAGIASDMQSVSGVADFRLIDPPRVSPFAVSTARSIQLMASIAFALGLGIGIMFLAKEVRARIYDRSQLAELTGLPILGTISMIVSDEQQLKNKKHISRFIMLTVVLFVLYIVVVVAGVLLTKQAT